MNLSEFKLQKDDGEHYHVTHPNGTQLKLHKKSLSYPAQRAIEKMACGGEVQKFDDGGTAYPEPRQGIPPSIAMPVDDVTKFDPSAPYLGGGPDYGQQYQQRIKENLQPSVVGGGAMAQDMGFGEPGKVMNPKEAEGKALTDTSEQQRMDLRQDVDRKKELAANAQSAYQSQMDEWNKKKSLGIDPGPMPQAPPQSIDNAQALGGGKGSNLDFGNMSVPQMGQTDPFADANKSQNQLWNKQIKDINDLKQGQLASGERQQSVMKDYADRMAKLRDPEVIYNDMMRKDHELMQDYLSQKIDPKNFVNHMSTGSKFAAGISMIFGGMGQGLIGGRNAGLDWLNNAISQDIESQKNEQGKKMTLWKMNREAYGDEQRAHLATQNQMATGLQAQLAIEASKSEAPMIKYRAQDMIHQIEQQKIQNRQKMAMLTAAQGGPGNGQFSNMDPAMLATHMGFPPEKEKEIVHGIANAQKVRSEKQELMDLYDRSEKEQSLSGHLERGSVFESPALKALRFRTDHYLKEADGRINEITAQHRDEMMPEMVEHEGGRKIKRQQFSQWLNQLEQAPIAKANGINLENFQSTTHNPLASLNPREVNIYRWSKANPNNPQAQMALKKFAEKGIK